MARARKSHNRHEEEVKTTRHGLETPYGQPGQNKYVIYVDYQREGLDTPKILILNFKARYAAKFFLNELIGSDEWEWSNPIGSRDCIKTTMGLRISMFRFGKGNDLEMLLDYEPTEQEAEWEDDQVKRNVARLKYGRTSEDNVKVRERDDSDAGRGDLPTERRNDKREPKPERVKVDKTGLISANDIAKELGVEGREVRGVLRAMKLEKPAGGWLFDKKTAEEIKDKVKKGLKKK